MKLLVIGSKGFIGKHCVEYFRRIGFKVCGVDIKECTEEEYIQITNFELEITKLIKSEKFDLIVNSSGKADINLSFIETLDDFHSNCMQTMQILNAIRQNSIKTKYIHISSAAVYGNPVTLPINEESEIKPVSPYGYHKSISEIICREYSELFGLNIAIIRPFSVYGIGLRKQILWDIFNNYLKNSNTKEIILYGTGNESRDYLYIDDLLEALYLIILNNISNFSIYNLASGIETKISELSIKFISYIDSECKIKFGGQIKEGNPINWKADISKISNLGFFPKISLEVGLKKVANWMINLTN